MTVRTAIPRGIRSFTLTTAVTAKPVNDTYFYNAATVLPPKFAYVMSDFACTIDQDVASDYPSHGYIRVADMLPTRQAAHAQFYPIEMILLEVDGLTAGAIASKVNEGNLPRMPLFGASQLIGTQVAFRMSNLAAAVGAAGTTRLTMSFSEYDLEQPRNFPVNTAAIQSSR